MAVREYDIDAITSGIRESGRRRREELAQGVLPVVFQMIPRSTGTDPGKRYVRLLSFVMLSCLSYARNWS